VDREKTVSKWRKDLLSTFEGDILEIGVGTGKNLLYYSDKATAIDISPKMLEKL
jgi:ubiquinone/menaquinone biosynthesis C-methylase UbiE